MKGIQLVRDRILYPGVVKAENSQPVISDMGQKREMSNREREKEEIRNLFCNSDSLYYSDIVEKLGISLRTVVEICDELKAAGEIILDERI